MNFRKTLVLVVGLLFLGIAGCSDDGGQIPVGGGTDGGVGPSVGTNLCADVTPIQITTPQLTCQAPNCYAAIGASGGTGSYLIQVAGLSGLAANNGIIQGNISAAGTQNLSVTITDANCQENDVTAPVTLTISSVTEPPPPPPPPPACPVGAALSLAGVTPAMASAVCQVTGAATGNAICSLGALSITGDSVAYNYQITCPGSPAVTVSRNANTNVLTATAPNNITGSRSCNITATRQEGACSALSGTFSIDFSRTGTCPSTEITGPASTSLTVQQGNNATRQISVSGASQYRFELQCPQYYPNCSGWLRLYQGTIASSTQKVVSGIAQKVPSASTGTAQVSGTAVTPSSRTTVTAANAYLSIMPRGDTAQSDRRVAPGNYTASVRITDTNCPTRTMTQTFPITVGASSAQPPPQPPQSQFSIDNARFTFVTASDESEADIQVELCRTEAMDNNDGATDCERFIRYQWVATEEDRVNSKFHATTVAEINGNFIGRDLATDKLSDFSCSDEYCSNSLKYFKIVNFGKKTLIAPDKENDSWELSKLKIEVCTRATQGNDDCTYKTIYENPFVNRKIESQPNIVDWAAFSIYDTAVYVNLSGTSPTPYSCIAQFTIKTNEVIPDITNGRLTTGSIPNLSSWAIQGDNLNLSMQRNSASSYIYATDPIMDTVEIKNNSSQQLNIEGVLVAKIRPGDQGYINNKACLKAVDRTQPTFVRSRELYPRPLNLVTSSCSDVPVF